MTSQGRKKASGRKDTFRPLALPLGFAHKQHGHIATNQGVSAFFLNSDDAPGRPSP